MWIASIYALAGFIAMEPISWAIHKYVMHGPLWVIHKTHHQPNAASAFELNDLFSLFFGSCSIALIIYGLEHSSALALGLGSGVAGYGFVYFILHDLFIHKRIGALRKIKLYGPFKRLANAHFIHHQNRKTPKSRFFGLLVARENSNPKV